MAEAEERGGKARMITIGLAEARKLAPAEYAKCLEAAELGLRQAAELREYKDAPPPIRSILLANAGAACDVERDCATQLDGAIRIAMAEKRSGLDGR